MKFRLLALLARLGVFLDGPTPARVFADVVADIERCNAGVEALVRAVVDHDGDTFPCPSPSEVQ